MKSYVAIAVIGFCFITSLRPSKILADALKSIQPTIQELIKALANKNEPPPIDDSGPGRAVFPPDYDWVEQARVISVWQKLHDRGEEAFPDLVAHVKDREYCVSCPHFNTGAWSNRTVGKICWYILTAHIEPYHRPTSMGMSHVVPKDPDKIREWWERRKDCSLAELQLEAISVARKNWLTIKVIRNGGPVLEEQRKEGIELLDSLAEKIKESGEPITVHAIDQKELGFRNYPWPSKKRGATSRLTENVDQ